jgi:hypothetical protein
MVLTNVFFVLAAPLAVLVIGGIKIGIWALLFFYKHIDE